MRKVKKVKKETGIETEIAAISEENLIPAWSMIELTHRCNLKCSHCYLASGESEQREEREVNKVGEEKKELTTKEVKNILDQLAEAGCLFLAFTGGEMFLRKDIWEILEYASEKRFAVTVLTNATLLKQDDIKKLKKMNIHELSTSLYSLKAEVHDGVTGVKGSYVKVIKALKEIKKAGIAVRIKTPLMMCNYSEKKAITKFAKKNGFKMLFDPVLAPKNDGSTGNTKQKIGTAVLGKVVKQHCSDWSYSNKYLERNVICSAGKNFVAVNPYGEVLSCLQIPVSAGNLRKKKFDKIWRNSAVLKKIRGMKLGDLKECENCKDIRYCNRCPGLALLENGSLYGRSNSACQIATIRSRYGSKK